MIDTLDRYVNGKMSRHLDNILSHYIFALSAVRDQTTHTVMNQIPEIVDELGSFSDNQLTRHYVTDHTSLTSSAQHQRRQKTVDLGVNRLKSIVLGYSIINEKRCRKDDLTPNTHCLRATTLRLLQYYEQLPKSHRHQRYVPNKWRDTTRRQPTVQLPQ